MSSSPGRVDSCLSEERRKGGDDFCTADAAKEVGVALEKRRALREKMEELIYFIISLAIDCQMSGSCGCLSYSQLPWLSGDRGLEYRAGERPPDAHRGGGSSEYG